MPSPDLGMVGYACIIMYLEHSLFVFMKNSHPLDSRVCMNIVTEVRTKVIITSTV